MFAENITELAREAGGQIPLAEKIGASQSAISRWSDGVRPRKLEALNSAAEFAGVTVDQLLNIPLSIARAQSGAATAGSILLLPVSLPSEAALTAMFSGFLETTGHQDLADELAPQLAQLLPAGLARAQDHQLRPAVGAATKPRASGARPRATGRP